MQTSIANRLKTLIRVSWPVLQQMRKAITLVLFFSLFLATGCVSKKEADRRAREAYMAGQKQAATADAKTESVWVVGNVANPILPWTSELTLAHAIIDAQYLGAGDPKHIVVIRNGTSPFRFTAEQLLSGFDMPLRAGDRIELRQ